MRALQLMSYGDVVCRQNNGILNGWHTCSFTDSAQSALLLRLLLRHLSVHKNCLGPGTV
jgi:hypothetical protein